VISVKVELLFKAIISPATCVVKVNTTRNIRCIPLEYAGAHDVRFRSFEDGNVFQTTDGAGSRVRQSLGSVSPILPLDSMVFPG
jgi:hypothetical protein